MSLYTFDPPIAPSPGLVSNIKPRILKAEFGDGYTQASKDGLNHQRRIMNLTWEVLTAAQADEILAFLEAHGGTTPFLYALPGEAAIRKWTAEEWNDERLSVGLRKVTATFTQSFTLEE
ncbi:phage tail protein [Propylenella binzhouense]|uniref:Phage tail protein n=1 Tax=Propylenella binzhouense TaxID=2555902 RepID=A0A964T127_9HYPH|nr:phage tail protein [Propylenella binzhouense]MYZ46463.1 hypothetical protein [Propylenella binzhouense]